MAFVPIDVNALTFGGVRDPEVFVYDEHGRLVEGGVRIFLSRALREFAVGKYYVLSLNKAHPYGMGDAPAEYVHKNAIVIIDDEQMDASGWQVNY